MLPPARLKTVNNMDEFKLKSKSIGYGVLVPFLRRKKNKVTTLLLTYLLVFYLTSTSYM